MPLIFSKASYLIKPICFGSIIYVYNNMLFVVSKMKSILEKFYPFEYVDSVFDIDYEKLYDIGYRGIIFDIDNTLVPHGNPSTKEIDEFFISIQKTGFKTVLLSDNGKSRIEEFLKNIDSQYIDNADKPHTKNFNKAVEMLELNKNEVVYIGDQVFKDIYGANKSGIDNILVKFIGWDTETKIGIRRKLEKIILNFYRLNKSYQNRIGYIEIEEKQYAV